MLILSRKAGQSVVIDRCLEVVVLEVRGGRVKLGFRGPSHVQIRRQELDEDQSGRAGNGAATERRQRRQPRPRNEGARHGRDGSGGPRKDR